MLPCDPNAFLSKIRIKRALLIKELEKQLVNMEMVLDILASCPISTLGAHKDSLGILIHGRRCSSKLISALKVQLVAAAVL